MAKATGRIALVPCDNVVLVVEPVAPASGFAVPAVDIITGMNRLHRIGVVPPDFDHGEALIKAIRIRMGAGANRQKGDVHFERPSQILEDLVGDWFGCVQALVSKRKEMIHRLNQRMQQLVAPFHPDSCYPLVGDIFKKDEVMVTIQRCSIEREVLFRAVFPDKTELTPGAFFLP